MDGEHEAVRDDAQMDVRDGRSDGPRRPGAIDRRGPHRIPPRAMARDTYRQAVSLVREGRSFLAPFDHARGVSWLEFPGPLGFLGNDAAVGRSSPPRLLAFSPAQGAGPVAEVALDGEAPLDEALERLAGVLLEEAPGRRSLLRAILRAVRAGGGRRARRTIPDVGEAVTKVGAPSLAAWAGCLTLADLQEALLSAVILRQPGPGSGGVGHEDRCGVSAMQ
jgi:hypothetical protein